MEEVKVQVKIKIQELKTKIKNVPKEDPFDFTEYVEKQKEDFEIDLSLFFELAEANKFINFTANTSKHSYRKYGKFEKWFFLRMVILL